MVIKVIIIHQKGENGTRLVFNNRAHMFQRWKYTLEISYDLNQSSSAFRYALAICIRAWSTGGRPPKQQVKFYK